MPVSPPTPPLPSRSAAPRRALVVRGGWEGHSPVETTELFLPALRGAGFAVEVADSLDVYCDAERLAATDLVVQCWSEGARVDELSREQSAGLVAAVAAGTGFAGWHGGVLAAFRNRDYLRMVGGLFVFHPRELLTYKVAIAAEHAGHPIVAGLADFEVHSEQYWMLSDARNTVLATTVVEPGDGGQGDGAVPMPVVWTRRWGTGKVFVSAIGHRVEDLRAPAVKTLTERGLLWAAR